MDILSTLLHPRAVAVLGASNDPTRIGGRPVDYMRRYGFAGGLYPINPKRETVQGLPAFPSIADCPGEVDLAVIALPADGVIDALGACAQKGVKIAVIFSAAFAEVGGEGIAKQAELKREAARHGIRVLGPNCLGLFHAESGLSATFTTTLDRGRPEPGPVALVSQSGAYGSHLYYLCRRARIGVATMITTGNEADVGLPELIEALAAAPDTGIIMAYAEGIVDGPRFLAACDAARANRVPIAIMKVGRSDVGAAAAASHTAALAGADAVYDAAFRQFGVHRARTTEELIDIAVAARPGIYPAGNRLGVVTMSGGAGVLIADAAADEGVTVPPMPAHAQARLKALLPFASPVNPVDITAQAFNQLDLVTANMEVILKEGGYDAVVAFFTTIAGSGIAEPLREAVRKGIEGADNPLIAVSMIAAEEIVRAYEANGMLVFEDPTRAVVAVAALMRFGASFAAARTRVEVTPGEPLPDGALDEAQSKALIAKAGIPVLHERVVQTPDEAADAAAAIGFPVALKIVSPDIAHKTEVGGLALELGDKAAVRVAGAAILERVRTARPDAALTGLLVSPMIGGGVEMIAGVQRDPVFGPVVMVGLGGIYAEVFKDVAFRVAPFDGREAHAMIAELTCAALLAGARGAPAADVDALADALAALSRFAAAHAATLETLDINPLVVLPRGHGCVALDALVIGTESA